MGPTRLHLRVLTGLEGVLAISLTIIFDGLWRLGGGGGLPITEEKEKLQSPLKWVKRIIQGTMRWSASLCSLEKSRRKSLWNCFWTQDGEEGELGRVSVDLPSLPKTNHA